MYVVALRTHPGISEHIMAASEAMSFTGELLPDTSSCLHCTRVHAEIDTARGSATPHTTPLFPSLAETRTQES